jgi:thiol-disulfide isomerase/thioredoxin
MKNSIIFFAFVCFLTLSACSVLELRGKELIGQPAPEARLMLIDGSEIPLSAQQGRNTVLLFWATWCSHSKTIIERYERLARKYSSRHDIDFYAVSVDKNDDLPELKRRIKSQELRTMTHIFSGNESQDDAFVSCKGDSIPYVVFIDQQGIVRVVESDLEPLEVFLATQFGGYEKG